MRFFNFFKNNRKKAEEVKPTETTPTKEKIWPYTFGRINEQEKVKKDNQAALNKMSQDIESYLEQIGFNRRGIINDSMGGDFSLKYDLISSSSLCNDILSYTALPPRLLNILSKNSLINLVISTMAREAARDLPDIEIYTLDEEKNLNYKDDLIKINERINHALRVNNISKLLYDVISDAKTYGVVTVLKVPVNEKMEASYWRSPFNLDSVRNRTDIEFKLITPDKMFPTFVSDDGVLPYNNLDPTEEPTYWNITFDNQEITVHKSHFIRVIEGRVSGDEALRYRHRGISLVETLAPICSNLEDAEKLRKHLMMLKGILVVKFSDDDLQRYDNYSCYPGGSSYNHPVNEIMSSFSSAVDGATVKHKMLPLFGDMTVENRDVSLADVSENIESLYRRLAALASLPVSIFGLTPPRGLNDTGAVEADGSRRAIESNQSSILYPVILEIAAIYAQIAIKDIKISGIYASDISYNINFKPANAPTEAEEAEIRSRIIDDLVKLHSSGLLSDADAIVSLQKAIPLTFDHLSPPEEQTLEQALEEAELSESEEMNKMLNRPRSNFDEEDR